MRKFLRFVINGITIVSFLGCLFVTGVFLILFYYGRGLPDHRTLLDYKPYLTNRFYLPDGTVWRDYSKEKRFYVNYDDVPQNVINAFLVAEDKSFFKHSGVDLMGVFRATIQNTLKGDWKKHPKGASTITQQVAKNLMIGNEKSFTRKIKEAILAVRIEHSLSKKHILELYLNQIYFGNGCYGIKAASEHYFHKQLHDLTIDEIAFLASLPKAPEIYQPNKNPSFSKSRRDWVLDRLYEEHYIDGAALLVAKAKPISTISRFKEPVIEADYFIEAARQELIEKVGSDAYSKGGYHIWTTVDPSLQRIAHTCLREGLMAYDKKQGYRGPITHLDLEDEKNKEFFKDIESVVPFFKVALVVDIKKDFVKVLCQNGEEKNISLASLEWSRRVQENGDLGPLVKDCYGVLAIGDVIYIRIDNKGIVSLEQIPEITGGILVMNSKTGEVLAVSGGFDFSLNQYNSATQANRQPGSAFKAFVFLAALERGFTPQSIVMDSPISIPLGFTTKDGKTSYSPHNYNNQYYGPTRLENALAYSRNVVTVRLAMMVGMKPIASLAQDFGVYQSLPKQLAMVLGAGETTLLKLTTAYAMIANGGNRIKARLINKIQDHDGETIDELYITDEDNTLSEKRRNAIRDLSSMLHLVVEKGTARTAIKPIADKYRTPIAGKTGTTNDYKDAWFIGYADDIVIGVFLGYPKPKNLGKGMTGGVLAAPIAAKFLDQYFALYPPFNQRQYFNINGDIGKLFFPFPFITVSTIAKFNWMTTLKIRFDSHNYLKRALRFF